MKKKWRGIQTTQKRINEGKAKTIINRLGQKSISLPRIDDKKRWAGYPSIAGIARGMAQLVPECKLYVEPFAGTAKVYQELIKTRNVSAILNDKSKFICKWLRKEIPNTIVKNVEFTKCILDYNYKDTFFLIDPAWFKSYYDQSFSFFNRNSVKEYDNDVLKVCRKIKGKFIITTRKENIRMLSSEFNNYLIKSEYVLCGKYPKVLLTTNMILRRLGKRI